MLLAENTLDNYTCQDSVENKNEDSSTNTNLYSFRVGLGGCLSMMYFLWRAIEKEIRKWNIWTAINICEHCHLHKRLIEGEFVKKDFDGQYGLKKNPKKCHFFTL